MNQRIELPFGSGRMTDARYFECDLFWPDAGFGIEYDSREYHSGEEKLARDAARYNALFDMGYRIMMVRSRLMYDVREMDRIAYAASRALGCRIRPRSRDYVKKKFWLRGILYR